MSLPDPVFVRAARDSLDSVAVADLARERWPFHGRSRLTLDETAALLPDAADRSREAYWILGAAGVTVGLLRILDLDDIDDGNPVFDLRIQNAYRGAGFGTVAVRWLTTMLFERYPHLHRISGGTRADNAAMRAVFDRCGYIQEAHYRQAWPSEDGGRHDSVTYAILRSEWVYSFAGSGIPRVTHHDDPQGRHVTNEDDDDLLVRHNRPMAPEDDDNGAASTELDDELA